MFEGGFPPSPQVQYLKLSFCTQITTAAPFAASKNNYKEVFQSCECFPSLSSTTVLVARERVKATGADLQSHPSPQRLPVQCTLTPVHQLSQGLNV